MVNPGVRQSTQQAATERPARTFDLVILALALWILSVVLIGRFDREWIVEHHLAEPLLALLVILPLRIVLGGRGLLRDPWSTLVRGVRSTSQRLGVRDSRFVDVTLLFVVTRIPELAVAFLTNVIFPGHRLRNFYMPFDAEKLAEIFAAWDSGWYFAIARYGTTRAASARATSRSSHSTRC